MAKELTRVKEDATGILSSDVLLQVLSRLPPKSIVRFRCVSTQWRNFISDPFFADIHYNQSKKKKPLMIQVNQSKQKKPLMVQVNHLWRNATGCFEVTRIELNTCSTEIFSLNFEPDYYNIDYSTGFLLFYGLNHYYVCNPSTRECFTTNHYLHTESSQNYSPISLGRVRGTGFGFLPSTSEFKFVVLYSTGLPELHYFSVVVTILTKTDVGSKKCMPVNCLDFENCLYLTFDEAICVSGIIYWRIKRGDYSSMDLREFLAFDLELEEFRVITCPLHYRWYSDYYLVDFKGELCLIDGVSQLPAVIDIWVLKDHKNETWAKKYTIDCSHFDQEWSLLSGYDKPRGVYILCT